jgi:peptidyl-dipeptidase Dcp
MHRREFLLTSGAVGAFAAMTGVASASPARPSVDTLLAPWRGPLGGTPPFDKVNVADIEPAILRAMDLHRAELAAIVADARPPTFDNTIAKMEDSGRALGRISSIFQTYTSTMNGSAMKAVEAEMSPKFAAFSDEITQNGPLFERVKAVYDAHQSSDLTPEQKRLTWVTYNRFARQGAALRAEHKTRLADINQALASAYTKFSQNQLADEESQALVLEAEADLAGLPESVKAAAAASAQDRGQTGRWAFANTRSAIEPFLVYSTRRDLREAAFRMWTSRGATAGDRDNRPVIVEILNLRIERAKLLGFPTHAHWILDANMAKTPERAMDLMMRVWRPAVARVREEVSDMQKIADADGVRIAAWDYRYYAEKVRKAKYDFDDTELKPYLQMEKIREGMFWAAGQLYGLHFTEVSQAPIYHPDVRVFEVTRRGERVGLWYYDPYARSGKQSGAWMSEYRTQEMFKDHVTPIVSNNCNFVKASGRDPVLISWDDASTMFHEFGHALHGLNSAVRYPTLAGTNTARDFVEFPSQINEHWLSTPEVLNRFAIHYRTGQPMPQALIDKLERARTFNQGFATVEYLASAIYDMKIHSLETPPADPVAFETAAMAEIGMPPEIVLRHRPTHFGHIFAGDGYSAGYYGYIWADTLTADAFEAFTEAGGAYDPVIARRFHDTVMSVGNTVPPEEAFRNFRGRDVQVEALMRDRGFPAG